MSQKPPRSRASGLPQVADAVALRSEAVWLVSCSRPLEENGPMERRIGRTLSHYELLERSAEAAWVSSTERSTRD